MANEIEIMNIKSEVNTGSVDLDKDVVYINEQIAEGRKSSHEVARTLLKIRNEGLFTVCASTFSDFCADFFKINKATGSKLCAVAERFLAPELGDTYADYSISKLMEMRGATTEQLAEIKPSMTVAEIRKILTPAKAIEDKSEGKSEGKSEDKSDNKSDNTNVGGITRIDPEKSRAMVERVEGTETTPTKFVGDGFELIMTDKNELHQAHITTFEGLKNFYDYMSCTFTPETIENNVKVNVVINL